MIKNTLFIFLAILFCQVNIFAQIDTIQVDRNDLKTEILKEERTKYLVYIEKPDGSIMDISIWEKEISFSKMNGEDVIVINQEWKNPDSKKTRSIKSINKRQNFKPLYHYIKDGKGTIEAYTFFDDKIIGTDSIKENSKKGFYIKKNSNTLNWELDMEVIQILPYKKNTSFKINFYHPGSKGRTPKYYTYDVIGESSLDLLDGKKVDCWMLGIKYSSKNHATFWVSKNSNELLKMVESFGLIKRYKIRLANK